MSSLLDSSLGMYSLSDNIIRSGTNLPTTEGQNMHPWAISLIKSEFTN